MPDASNLYLFMIAAALLLVVPGPSMAFVTSHALSHGWRAGLAAALGITLADLLMTVLASAGVGALVMSWAPAFDLLRLGGAGYLLWLAWQALKRPTPSAGGAVPTAGLRKVFMRSTVNSLLNPKGLLFFMVFLPQFVSPANGSVTLQLLFLGTLLALIALAFHTLLGICAGRLHKRFRLGKGNQRLGAYGFAGLMTMLAVRLLLLQRST